MSLSNAHKSSEGARPNCKSYVSALRPWSFTASLTPVLLGSALSYKSVGAVNFPACLIAGATALAVHAAGNLVNTYYDFKRGVDNKKSDDRTLVDRMMRANDVAFMGGLFYGLGCLGLLSLMAVSSARVEHLALVYFCGLSASFLYTGGLGLKYIALGDLVIFLTFGPVTVVFAYLAATGELSAIPIPYAIPLALNIECVLHANNCRDRKEDKAAGIITVAILLGEGPSYFLFCFLLFGPYVTFVYVAFNFSWLFILPSATIMLAFPVERSFRASDTLHLPQRIARLNLVLGITFIVAIVFSDKSKLPFLS